MGNKNSIVFIFEYKKHLILFTGDAWAEDILIGLGGRIHKFYFVKLSHHGSVCNISENYPDYISCSNFLICTDGIMHPDKQTIAKLIKWYGKICIYSPSNWWSDRLFLESDDTSNVKLFQRDGEAITWKI